MLVKLLIFLLLFFTVFSAICPTDQASISNFSSLPAQNFDETSDYYDALYEII